MKKYIFILFLLLLPGLVLAQDNDEAQYNQFIDFDFSKGQTSHISDYNLGTNQAKKVQNIRINDVFSSIQKRDTLISYGTTESAKVDSLYRYYKNSDSSKYLIASSGTNLYYGDDDTKTFTSLFDDFSSGKRFTFNTFQDMLIGMNGTDRPFKWDGSTDTTANTAGNRTALNLIADLGAPIADLTTGSNLDTESWYQYKVLFLDADSPLYYYTDARSNAIQTGLTVSDVMLTDIPLGKVGVTQRQIYRTEGNSTRDNVFADTTFKLVTVINDNSTQTYTDTITDLSLGVALSTSGAIDVTPPIGKFSEIHNSKLFVANAPLKKSHLFWSDDFNPDWFQTTDFEKVRPDDGDEITFLETFLGILTIGKTNTIQKFYTDGAVANWYLSDPFSRIGCHAPYSPAITPKGIFYLNRYGLYLFNGQFSSLVSDVVTDVIRDIAKADIDDTAGIYWNNQYYLAYTSDESGGANNNRVLLYDLTRDAYVIDTKNVESMAVLESGDDLGNLFYGSSLTDGKVFEEGTKETFLIKRFKSDFDSGVYDDMRSFGTEDEPILKLAWDLTGSSDWSGSGYPLAGDMSRSGGIYLGAREDTDGDWTSPIYKVDASEWNEIEWNEDLNSYGDVEFRIRSAATEAGLILEDWSAGVTDPNGSDISSLTASTYLQIQANLSTSDIVFTPNLFKENNYLFKVSYSKQGTPLETTVNSIWESGWKDFIPHYPELLKRMRIYYRGIEGTLTINYKNIDGDITRTFDIDLSVDPSTDLFDEYTGSGDFKVFTHVPGRDSSGNAAIGEMWNMEIVDSGTSEWTIDRLEVLYDRQEIKL